MGHPKIINRTPFVFEALFVADENGRPLCVPIVKATFAIGPGGALSIAERQLPLELAGTFHGEPGESSYVYEPETAFFKPATDVVLIGDAHADKAGATEVVAGIRVGSVQKLVKVVGDRFMSRRSRASAMTRPRPFEQMPLTWERAFGGWDRRHPDRNAHRAEPRNPVGTGFRDASYDADDDVRLPNLEDPQQPAYAYGDRPSPVGVGFVAPNWAPRAQLAGTYDERWATARSPLLPVDFDRRFFNAAAPGLVASGYLRGDEDVVVLNASPEGRLAFRLPDAFPPECRYRLNGRKKSAAVEMHLDTVIVNTADRHLIVIWRAHFPLRTGPHDLVVLRARSVGALVGV